MKCICGYEHKQEFVNENGVHYYKTTVGDNKFIKIKGTFLLQKEYDYAPDAIEEIDLYACPKCGTIKTSQYDNWNEN